MLRLVRGETETSREPQPSLADLDRLITRTREAGLPVVLEIVGDHRALPAVVELSAFRIIQEGLTNVLKHADATCARVVLRYDPAELRIEVADDGPGMRTGQGSRRGLAGRRERVGLFGGVFDAGPHPEGGWRLSAGLPVAS